MSDLEKLDLYFVERNHPHPTPTKWRSIDHVCKDHERYDPNPTPTHRTLPQKQV